MSIFDKTPDPYDPKQGRAGFEAWRSDIQSGTLTNPNLDTYVKGPDDLTWDNYAKYMQATNPLASPGMAGWEEPDWYDEWYGAGGGGDTGGGTLPPGVSPPPGKDVPGQEVDDGGYYGNSWDNTVQYDDDDKPIAPPVKELFDPAKDYMTLDPSLTSGSKLDYDFMDIMKKEGTREAGTASTWRDLMDDKLDLMKLEGRDRLGEEQASLLSGATNRMAMRGGVGGSARERLSNQAIGQGLEQQQGLERRFDQFAVDLDVEDEKKRLDANRALGDARMGIADYQSGVDQYNISNALRQHMFRSGLDAKKYSDAMAAWGAEQTANAAPSGDTSCCSIALISSMSLGGINSAKAQDIINGSKIDRPAIVEKYEGDTNAMEFIDTLTKARKVRDNLCNEKELRGYYKFSEVTAKHIVKSPMVVRLGYTLWVNPVMRLADTGKSFLGKAWIKFFGLIGGKKPFVRSNGEIV